MKNCLFPLTIASLFALAQPALSQEKATPTPTATPEATPKATATPEATATPAAADASPGATAEPTATPEASPASQAEATAPASPSPSASPASKSDADFLPEPTDASLGAPIEANPDAVLPTNDVAPSDLPNPDNLIPQGTGTGTAGSDEAPPAPAKPVENKFEQDRKLQVRYQQVKLQALKDADIRSLLQQADAAKTDEMKRQALREYYRLLFAKMTAIDATLKDKCDVMQQAYLRRLGQYRVSPSIPLHPPPTPEPLAN